MKYTWMLVLGLFLFSCENTTAVNDKIEEVTEEQLAEVDRESEEVEEIAPDFDTAQEFAVFCLSSMESGDFDLVAPYVAEKLLLSPNAYIEAESVQEIDFKEVMEPTDKVYLWGQQPGSGFPIKLTVPAYFDKFVLDIDINNNEEVEVATYSGKPIGRGSELHNMQDLYSGCEFVEFFIPPSEEGFIDWSALFLIVCKEEDGYILKGMVHNLWTP